MNIRNIYAIIFKRARGDVTSVCRHVGMYGCMHVKLCDLFHLVNSKHRPITKADRDFKLYIFIFIHHKGSTESNNDNNATQNIATAINNNNLITYILLSVHTGNHSAYSLPSPRRLATQDILQSASGRFRFLVPPSGTTCLSTSHMRRHSRFSDYDSRPFCFPVPTKTLSYDSCVTITIHHYCLETCGPCNN